MTQKKIENFKKRNLIYVLTTTYFDSKKQGFVHTLNKSLVKAGFNVKTITHHKPGAEKDEIVDSIQIKRFTYLPERFEIKYSVPEEFRRSKPGMIKVLVMMFGYFFTAFFECLKQKPNLLIGRWAFPSGYIAYLVARIFGIKNVVEIYGSEVAQCRNSKLIRSFLIPCMNNSTLVIANSNYTMNEFIKMGVKENRIIKIGTPPNYVPHTSNRKFLEEFRKKFANEDQKILLFVGHLIELKGAEYAIRSLQYVKNNIHLIIAGDGILMNDLKKLARSLNLEEKITFFGMASPEELGWLHDISDVFVCPPIVDSKGFTENLCKVIPEAMESGLPVIATNVGGVPEVVQNEKTGLLVKQKDPQFIAKAIDRILSDKDLQKILVTNSKKIVEEFSLKKLEKKYVETIKIVIEN